MLKELTEDQLIELKVQFVEFKLNQMTHEDLYQYVRDIMMLDVDPDPEILKDTIDEYDDNLYDVLVPYVLDEDGAYDILQEYIHDLHSNDWIDDWKFYGIIEERIYEFWLN